MSKAGTLIWFLARPCCWGHLGRIARAKLFPGNVDGDRDEAARWCAELAVDTGTALERLIGMRSPASVESLFSDYMEEARRRVRECPARMGGAADLDLLYWSAEHLQATRVIETGVAYGWSSLAILLSLHSRPGSMLVSTDMPYPNRNAEAFVGCAVPADLASIWTIIRRPDRRGLPRALKTIHTIDLCHYDSDKSRAGRRWAYPLLWKALRPGGYFISDDVGDNTAFREFSAALGCNPIIVHTGEKYAGILIKP